MRVKDFYRMQRCRKDYVLTKRLGDNGKNRYAVLSYIIRQMSNDLASGKSLGHIFEQASVSIEELYDDSAFEYPDKVKDEQKAFDSSVIKRFLLWLKRHPVEILEANVETIASKLVTGANDISQNVSLVIRTEAGQVQAWIISWRNRDFSSTEGARRQYHSILRNRLEVLIPKAVLEKKYPGIEVAYIRLVSDADTEGEHLAEFSVGSGKNKNVEFAVFGDDVVGAIRRTIAEPVKKDCNSCRNKGFCELKRVTLPSPEQVAQALYGEEEAGLEHLPYNDVAVPTSEQLQVVNFREGAMRVCAPPGSGKTNTLVWRIKKLIESGVEPEKILALTFTNKAAQEIRDRIGSSNTVGAPAVMTLNGLGDMIIRQCHRYLGKLKLLTPRTQKHIISEMLEVIEPLPGFSYNRKYGYGGVVDKVSALIDEWKKDGEDTFINNHQTEGCRNPVCRQFNDFAKVFFKGLKDRGFIDYDEQKRIPSRLLREHPELLKIYQNVFSYIMIDEFQDVNDDDVDFIYQIAQHGNIVVVGDDDQSIYEFRGSSARYMLSFNKAFPNAKTVVLTKNFRSTRQITDLSTCLIAGNVHRIPKTVVAMKDGVEPKIICNASDAASIETLIGECRKKGYDYGDIAVIGRKNSELKNLIDGITKVPVVLAKSVMITEPFFKICRDTMCALYGDGDGMPERLRLAIMLGGLDVTNDFSDSSVEFMVADDFLKLAESVIRDCPSPVKGLDKLAALTGFDNSPVYEGLRKILRDEKITGYDAFAELLHDMEESSDSTTVEKTVGNRVTLITAHDSKGKEWPVVIVLNGDQSFKDNESDRRLMFVAVTRAKDVLYICKSSLNKPSLADKLISA